MKFRFPIVIIDEDFRSENTSGLGIRALADAISKEVRSFSGVHGMMPPVSLPFEPQTLLRISFQALACGTAVKTIAAANTNFLIIASS